MGKRLASSFFLGVVVVLASVYYPVCGFMVTLLIVAGLYEFFYMVEKKGVKLFKLFGIVIGVLIPITIYFHFSIKEGWQFLFAVLGLFVLFVLEITKKETHQAVLSLSTTVFGIIYISWCFSFLIRVRQLPEGALLVAFLVVVTKSSDIGAYLWGRKYGERRFLKG